jgi:GNAT superfamily N-acetyltransferase
MIRVQTNNIIMYTVLRTTSSHPDFLHLVHLLDAELAIIDQEDHAYYSQQNTLDPIRYVVVAYANDQAVGCGALKEFAPGVVEVKRMYTLPEMRGKGIATLILLDLESWAAELGYDKCVLETGKRLPDAIRLYERNGYAHIPKYGPYVNMENSVCFEKKLLTSNLSPATPHRSDR